MKLIIDIPEEDRKDICNIHFVREDLKFKIGKAIMNGTPLDDVKAEIKAKLDDINMVAKGLSYGQCRYIQESLVDIITIIDKHISGKGN